MSLVARAKPLRPGIFWLNRHELFDAYCDADDPVAALEALPWIGAVTALNPAKNLAADVATPVVPMERLARAEGTTTAELCARLASETVSFAKSADRERFRIFLSEPSKLDQRAAYRRTVDRS